MLRLAALCPPPGDLRYSAEVRPNPLRNLLGASIQIAEAYLEQKVLQRSRSVSIIIPSTENNIALQEAIRDADSQTYPYKEIFVCDFSPTGKISLESARIGSKARVLRPSIDKDVFSLLEKETTGDYVAWLYPGDRMRADNIMKLVACIESQEYAVDFLLQNVGRNAETWSAELCIHQDASLVTIKSAALWQKMVLPMGQVPVGGLSSLLLPRPVMQRLHFFRDAFLNGMPLRFFQWKLLLQDSALHRNQIGMIEENYVERAKPSLDGYILHQLEWYALVLGEREEFESQEFETILAHMLYNRDHLAQSGQVYGNSAFAQAYDSMIKEIETRLTPE